MIMLNHQCQRSWLIASAILLGLAIELFNKMVVSPGPGIADTFEQYAMYYLHSSLLRFVLFTYTLYVIYAIRGSKLLWLFLTVQLVTILWNLLYQSEVIHHLTSKYRVEYFSPAYRITEVMILVRMARDVLPNVWNSIGSFLRRVYFVVTCWQVLRKDAKK